MQFHTAFVSCRHIRSVRYVSFSPYSIVERRVTELIPVLGSQPAGDVSHKPGGKPLLSYPPGLQLPSQPLRGLLPISLLGEQRHDGCVSSLPKTASRLRYKPRPSYANHSATEPPSLIHLICRK